MEMTTRNRRFTSPNGKEATVWQTFTTGKNVTGFTGLKRCTRTFVTVDGDDREFECEPGCSFQAERVVREAMQK